MDAGWTVRFCGAKKNAVHPASAVGAASTGSRVPFACVAWLAALLLSLNPAGGCADTVQTGSARNITLAPATLSVKVENGYAVAQEGARSFRVFDLTQEPAQGRVVAFESHQLGVVSFTVEDFSISADGVFYVAAYVNFGLGDSRYALLRYAFQERDAQPQLRHLPDVRCRFLGAGSHGVWCLDPDPREMRAEPPTLSWISFLGTVRRYSLLREPGVSLGPPRVVVVANDVAETWLPSMRAFVEAHPVEGVRAQAPIPVDPASRALTSFAVSPGGRIQALAPLRENGVEMLNTPYALVELDSPRKAWRRLLPGRRFERGSLLAGWSAGALWLWSRETHSLETIEGVGP